MSRLESGANFGLTFTPRESPPTHPNMSRMVNKTVPKPVTRSNGNGPASARGAGMSDPPLPSLPWHNLVEAFPFVFGWGEDLLIRCWGPSIQRVADDLAPGVLLPEIFELQRPEAALSIEWLKNHAGILLLLRHRKSGTRLRGQVMCLESGTQVFLGAPWLNGADDLDRIGLTLADFAPHDSAQDLLQVVQGHRMANAELKGLTEKLRAKQARLTEKEAESRKLAMVAERTDNAVIVANREGKIEWVNVAFERMTGWRLEEVKGRKPGDFLQGPRTDPEAARIMGARLRAGEGFYTEILNYRKDGTEYWVNIEVQPILDDEGRLTHFMAIETDISEKKRREIRRQLETAIANVIAGNRKRSAVIPAVLKAITTQLGWVLGTWWVPSTRGGGLVLAAEWHGDSTVFKPFLEASRKCLFQDGQGLPGRVMASGTSHWVTDVRQDANFPRREAAAICGLTAALAFPVQVDGEVLGVVEFFSLHLDSPDPDLLKSLNRIGDQLGLLLKRLETEEALVDRERAMNEGQRLAHMGTWEWDLRTNALSWSDEKYRIYGFEPRSFIPTFDHVKSAVLPEDLPRFLDVLNSVAETGLSQEVSYRVTRPDGEIRHVHTRAAADCDADNRPVRLVGTMQDVTEAILVENAYKEAQRISHLGNWSLDLASGAVSWSDEKYRIYGYEPGSVKVDLDFCQRSMHPEDVDAVMAFIKAVTTSHQPMTTTYRIIRPDGEVRHLRSSAEARCDASGNAREILGTVLDITELVEAQRTLEQTEERWQFALQNNGLGVWDWNVVSGFVLYTDRLQQMLGYEPGEWPQHVDSWASRVHPDDMPSVSDAMGKCLQGETPDYICEHRLRCKDGSWKWVQDVGRIVSFTKDGKPLRMIGTQMDIHIRKQSEDAAKMRAELLNRIRSAQEHFIGASDVAPVFGEMLDVIVSHTHSAFGFIGEVLKDTDGNPYVRSYALTDIAWDEGSHQLMDTLGPMGLEFRNLNTLFGTAMATGEVVVANDAANDPRSGGLPPGHPPLHTFLGLPVYNGLEMVGLVGLANKPDGYDKDHLKDLDPFLAAVSSMIVARREAERRRQIEEELRTARDKAEQASRAKSDFLAMISHEIRTPMNGVLGMAGLLKTSRLDAKQAEMVDAVLQSGSALVNIIDDILDFAKIEAAQIDLREQPVVLEELVEGVADLLHQEAASKGLELVTIIDPDLPDCFQGDQGRLRQVLLNLAGNAVKFTDKGHVTLRVTATGSWMEFHVMDTGIGIPPEARDRLFKPFSQVDSSNSRRFGGTGLGLAICKKLVNAMRGEIGIHSQPGKGSDFWFRVPFTAQKRNRQDATTGSAKPRRIWIAHSSPRLRESIRCALAGPGIEIREIRRTELPQTLSKLRDTDDALLVNAAWMKPLSAGQSSSDARRIVLIDPGGDTVPSPAGRAVIHLPLHRQALRSAVHNAPKATDNGSSSSKPLELGLQVLVAEDNRINARLACLLLENLGCHTTVAVNGKEAVAAFQTRPFDVILMDCQMPVMDGHAATRKIRRLEAADSSHRNRCKIIAMTASALPEERERCLASGMDDYLSKPFDAAKLADLLAGVASRPRTAAPEPSRSAADTISVCFDQLAGQVGSEEAVQLAQIWLEEAPARLQQIVRSLSRRDLEGARKAAHTLRGSSSMFGMNALIETCAALETAIKRNQPVPAGLADTLTRHFQDSLSTLGRCLTPGR